jgi:hypothetical protein
MYTLPRSHEVKLIRTKCINSLSPEEVVVLDEIIALKSESDPLFGY